ncbi:MAG TPA: translation initiation factor IF-2 associated domain-containing protein, partial [Xanthobacteraceae bacterium]|nr:translation initiation factor IF-2 associated domain-containing protein [Xanthobacteraceae bacterium]
MNDTKNPGEKTMGVGAGKTLTLKRPVEQGVVRQSFSHGRSKAVVVEKVKRRVIGPGEGKPDQPAGAAGSSAAHSTPSHSAAAHSPASAPAAQAPRSAAPPQQQTARGPVPQP